MKCYCIHCGCENDIHNKRCSKCRKKINESDRVLIDYLFGEAKGEIKDNIFSSIKNFLKKNLYGVLLSITVVGSITANVIVRSNDNTVNIKPEYIGIESPKYESTNELMKSFQEYYLNKDFSGLSTLLLETNYPEEAKKLNSNTSNHLIFQNMDLLNLHNPLIGFNIFSLRKIIDADGSSTRAEKYASVGYPDADFVVYRLIYEYNGTDYPLFDFNFITVNVNGYYYISEMHIYPEERFNTYKERNGDLSIVGDYYEM